jgi:hypothetical protein
MILFIIVLAIIGAVVVCLMVASLAVMLTGHVMHKRRLRRDRLAAVEAYRVPATRIPLRILMRPRLAPEGIIIEQQHAIGCCRVPELVWLVVLRRVSAWRTARSVSY